ncbi:MAG: NAD(P)H-hydrate dehydratase [Clostridiales bacterium]|jgi:hydroxyethylthiazole kinase-like uncharacterized protein yjeF|nr:NAD(P)H-hydrate dehydratase [Clostridiales bacterium]
MRVVTPKQMREIDRKAMEEHGIPGIVLMENAGIRLAEEVLKLPGEEKNRVVLIAGKGNNGGDVLVAARHLFNKGVPIRVFLVGASSGMAGDAGVNAGILDRMGIPVVEVSDGAGLEAVKEALGWGQVVVDGIFGTGFKGELRGVPLEIIRAANGSGCAVVSADIPSGIDGETGRVCGECVHASVTVTFGYPKVGLLQYPGAEYVGRLVVADISIPGAVAEGMKPEMIMLTDEYISGLIPGRKPDAHKGSCGRTVVIGGSEGMTGAVVMALLGCLKSGAGLVKAALPGALNYVIENRVTEAMSVPLGEGTVLRLDDSTRERLASLLDWASAAVLGPGMGVYDGGADFLEFVLANARCPLVLDADALNCLAGKRELLKKASVPVVVTPHPGEMARLAGQSINEIQADRIKAAAAFSKEWGTVTVLKGANSVIAEADGNIYINTTGNPGMASGGMGDVLAGMIASFMAQGLEPTKAACVAVYIHGRAADLLAGERGMYGLTASELAERIPPAIKLTTEG